MISPAPRWQSATPARPRPRLRSLSLAAQPPFPACLRARNPGRQASHANGTTAHGCPASCGASWPPARYSRSPPAAPCCPLLPTGPPRPATPGRSPAAAGSTQSADPGIYRLLPFTGQQLAAAAALTRRFTALYGTYRHDQPPASYLARLEPLTTSSLQAALALGATAPGLLQERAQEKATVTSTATVTAIRDITGTSITFLVTADQDATTADVTHHSAQDYAITVAMAASTWKVYAIEPADTGQAGSMP